MGFSSIKDYVDSEESGNYVISGFRKIGGLSVGAAGIWIDFSVMSGNPRPNFYASTPLESAALNGNYGLYHGQNVESSKFLKQITLALPNAGLPHIFTLCDYLMYYPFIDGDETAEQVFDNTITLPRYEDGIGVRAFLVAQSSYTGGQSYTISYTNSDGVSGRISPPVIPSAASGISGTLFNPAINSNSFIPLQAGDKGIRSVQSITMSAPNGGLQALVLARPIAMIRTTNVTASAEKVYLMDTGAMPKIENGAYLSFLVFNSVNTGANYIMFGSIETVWGDN